MQLAEASTKEVQRRHRSRVPGGNRRRQDAAPTASVVAGEECAIKNGCVGWFGIAPRGDDAVRTDSLDEAYAKYVRGPQTLLNLDMSHPRVVALNRKIAEHVKAAEDIKEVLEARRVS